MKLAYLWSNISSLPDVLDIFDELHIDSYQVIEEVKAKSRKGDPRFDTPVWPGYNAIAIAQLDNESLMQSLIKSIEIFNDSCINENELIFYCILDSSSFFIG